MLQAVRYWDLGFDLHWFYHSLSGVVGRDFAKAPYTGQCTLIMYEEICGFIMKSESEQVLTDINSTEGTCSKFATFLRCVRLLTVTNKCV